MTVDQPTADQVKRPLGIPEGDRRDMLDMLLRINRIAMATFDCVEADAWDPDDVAQMAALPDACNDFTRSMSRQAVRCAIDTARGHRG